MNITPSAYGPVDGPNYIHLFSLNQRRRKKEYSKEDGVPHRIRKSFLVFGLKETTVLTIETVQRLLPNILNSTRIITSTLREPDRANE